jgi:tetratricopeptide (TPR) repeat protein
VYERYEPTDRVFVDREEYLEWMDEALQRCKEKSVVLHLRGIGGIGKSSLLDYWKNKLDATIVLDCQQYTEFYDRLNVLAKGAVLLGVSLPRFDVLWQIRQRFVQGVEPVRESGREWAKEVITAIPFIGSLASIGSAISAVGAKVTPKLKGKYGTIGKWLKEKLGKNHVEQLLEILWKNPRHSEFLYLDALLEDINDRKNLTPPILFLFDHFEYVDAESTHWRYAGKEITETELWCVFLSSLHNCVGVMASRRPVTDKTEISIEESELTELDRESCIELLDLRQITDSNFQERIVSVSGGNPFVIGTLCDMAESSTLSLGSIESLRAETLEEVRLKTWRRLFNQVKDLQGLVNRAGLLPYFSRNVLNIITPDMNTDQWDRLTCLSFVRDRDDGTYVLHDLARDLVIAELGERFHSLANEVERLLENASIEQEDIRLLGLSISVLGLHSSDVAIEKLMYASAELSWKWEFRQGVEFLNVIRFESQREQAIVGILNAWHLTYLDRIAEAEHILKELIVLFEELVKQNPAMNQAFLADCYQTYAVLLHRTKRSTEAEVMFEKSIENIYGLDETDKINRLLMIGVYWWFSAFLRDTNRLGRAVEMLERALELRRFEEDTPKGRRDQLFALNNMAGALLALGRSKDAEEVLNEVNEICVEDVNRANNLELLGRIYKLTFRLPEAETAFHECIDIVRSISERISGTDWPSPSGLLSHLAHVLKLRHDYPEAERKYNEDLEISRSEVSNTPEVYMPYLASALIGIGILYQETGRSTEAAESYREALEIYERLCRDMPRTYTRHKALVLNNYANHLMQIGKVKKAETHYHEALGIARELTRDFPEPIIHSHLLGVILNNLGVLFRNRSQHKKAVEALREALEVRQSLAEKNPDIFLTSLATTLNNLGVALAASSILDDAKEVYLQGLKIRRDLVKKSSEIHEGPLGYILNNLGNVSKFSDEHAKAEKYYQEALDLLENLAAKAPSVYQRYVTMVLSNLLLYNREHGETEMAESIRGRLEELGSSDIPEQEVWIEEKDTEAYAFL